ncbi:uncharacterized protein GGS25DRAFT_148826 [Hypoxylon fragiforme]|uniref:uncharacterized protein n=1 Tax=Hypoxylon fragiforme TaxID=63214 RepID=UPI0020C713E0|nr:uncharacterized protein GGS25DRAFT_148826 [Hypoxylon fragiforme]KAI2613066.1 hypothetical protein GGS25DRAFT_148826 [Hypoxylon fragiforme]
MSAPPTSPGPSEPAADQPKDNNTITNQSLSMSQPKSQLENYDDPVTDKSPTDENKPTSDYPAKSSPPSSPSAQSSQSLESGEASPVRSEFAAADSSAPPLPNEPPPATEDDGWDFHWDATNQAYFFFNRFTNEATWENPRLANKDTASTSASQAPPAAPTSVAEPPKDEEPPAGGYNPAIHGDYDPTAWYAQKPEERVVARDQAVDSSAAYAAIGSFNRFTGKWQGADQSMERHNDEAKSKRQMNAFFDVDAAANSHDGRSLKAERSGKKPTKAELKQFKEKRRARKEEKRRAWLRD